MKKIFLFIVSILFFGVSFWYDVIIYWENNQLLFMYEVEQWTTEITLDWDWTKNWNNYTFNGGFNWTTVHYVDWYWNNQFITINSDLYINWDYSIWYTGQQELLLTENQCWSYNWYVPVFDITWWINDVTETWNVFNNFAENSLKVLLSNVPSYIQYVIIILILLFVLWFIKKIRRRK